MPLTDLAPVTRRNVYELVAENILALVSDRRLNPGDVLPNERELMHAYGVGRSSVREALRMLESQGVIRPTGKGGFAVAEYGNPLNLSLRLLLALEETTLRDLFEVRRIIEVETAALAAAHRRSEHLASIEQTIDDMTDGLAAEDRYISADVAFHLAIASASGNPLLQHMMLAIREVLRRALTSIYHIPASAERSIEDHRTILAALTAGDVDGARIAMRDHLVRVEADIRDVLASDGRATGAGRG